MNKEKVKAFVKKHWRGCAKSIVIGCGCTVCYIAGYKSCENFFSTGMTAACLVDPELKDRIINANKIVKERIG